MTAYMSYVAKVAMEKTSKKKDKSESHVGPVMAGIGTGVGLRKVIPLANTAIISRADERPMLEMMFQHREHPGKANPRLMKLTKELARAGGIDTKQYIAKQAGLPALEKAIRAAKPQIKAVPRRWMLPHSSTEVGRVSHIKPVPPIGGRAGTASITKGKMIYGKKPY